MRLIGARVASGEVVVVSPAEDGETVTVVAGLREFWSDAHRFVSRPASGELLSAAAITAVPPVLPEARVFCIGLNYRAHVAEGSYSGHELPPYPTVFGRWSRTLSVNGASIPVPGDEDGVDWEGEVMAYVGNELVDASPDDALDAVVGYSTFNDVTSRRAQKATSQWTLGKNADLSGPLGALVPAHEVGDLRDGLRVETRVNGEVMQSGSTDQMIYTVGDTLSHISRVTTLYPGDLLATGTPSGVGYARTPPRLLGPGDVVEVTVERLGTLTNLVVANGARVAAAVRARTERLDSAAGRGDE